MVMRPIERPYQSAALQSIGRLSPIHISSALRTVGGAPATTTIGEDAMTYRRGWIALLIFTAVIINYIDRVALSVAAKPIAAEFGFSPVQMGYLFSGFLWTYVVCLIPLGLLVE